MITATRRRLAIAAAAASLIAPVAATAATTSASAASRPYCGIYWGSLQKSSTNMTQGNILDVRSGRHACFDRVVFDIGKGSGTVGYTVRYVSSVRGPSGAPVALNGGAKLQVTVNAPAAKQVPPSGVVNYSGWNTFRQLKWVSSFEGYTDFGLGVRARLPMRVFTLPSAGGGQRLVIDVANRW
ncbi:MAG: hypothetical protein L0H25_09015 [Micrococcales bacterium]|nr:hypothetical protein [Micrococcales bacterium]